MKRFFIIVILFLSINICYADNYPTGASNLSLANSTVAVPNLWSVYHNQGALGFLTGTQIGIYYHNNFALSEFAVKSFAIATNVKPGTFGFNYTNYGFNKFSDNKFGLAYSMKLAKFLSLGIQMDYFLIQQDNNYGNIHIFSGEIGLLANPFENFYLGVHVFNPWRSKVAEYQDERMPTIFRLGVAYNFSKDVQLSTEVEKDLEQPAFFKTGLQYEPLKNFVLRTGVAFSQKDILLAFGLGYTYKDITLDLGFENHPILGMKTAVTIQYAFGGNK